MFAASKSGRAGASTDPFFPYVTALPEPIANSIVNTTVADSSAVPVTVTRNGTVSTGFTSPYQTNGYWGNYFGGTGNYAVTSSTPIATTTSTFTIECWILPIAAFVGTYPVVVGDMQPASTNNYFSFGPTSSNTLQLYWYDGAAKACTGNTTIQLNVWTHIAVSVSSNTISLYVNGTQQTLSGTTTLTSRAGTISSFAIAQFNSANNYYTGYISNLSVLNGTAKYSAGFTPATSPLSTSTTNQTLLTCYSNRFIDSNTATTAKTITVVGTPQVTPYYYPSTFTAPAASIGSGLFNGSTDYLTAASNAAFTFGTGNFTVEGWFYLNGLNATADGIFVQGTSLFPSSVANTVAFATLNTTNFQFYANGAQNNFSPAVAPVLNQWYHFAIVRNSGTTTAYLNGVSRLSIADSTNYTGTYFGIGNIYGFNGYLMNGYISNLRVVNGVAVYTGAFTPPTNFLQTSGSASAASYPSTTNVNTSFAASSTSLLINLADSNSVATASGGNNNVYLDSSPNGFNLVRNGINNTQVSFTPYWPNGQWSNYFNGSTDYLTVTDNVVLQPGSGDFTFEAWVYPLSLPSASNYKTFWAQRSTTGAIGGAAIVIDSTGTFQYFISNSGANNWQVVGSSTGFSVTLSSWQHIALTRSGNTLTFYKNGVAGTTATVATGAIGTSGNFSLMAGSAAGGQTVDGYMSNFRMVKGTAVYTAAFTPPTTPLTAITNTSLLTCQSNRFRDNSTNNFAITVNGTPRVQAFQPFSPVASYTTAAYGGSGYFSGSGDYLSIAYNANLSPGVGNFTIEFFYNSAGVSSSSYATQISNGVVASASSGAWLFGTKFGASNAIWFAFYNGTVFTDIQSTSVNPNDGAWHHLAAVRSGSTITLYFDGVSITSGSSALTLGTTDPTLLGYNSRNSAYVGGYISNLRLVKGTAVYTGAFTPPTLAPLTTAGSTSAASYPSTTNVNTSFAASSTSLLANFANAAVYDASLQNPFFTGTSFVTNATSPTPKWTPLSMKFDGTANSYITTTESSNLSGPTDLATTVVQAWTMECWVYYTAGGKVISRGGNPGSTSPSYDFSVSGGTGTFTLASASGIIASPGYTITYPASTIPTSTWVHWAATRTTAGIVATWVNGVYQGSSGTSVSVYNINNSSFSLGCFNNFYGIGNVLTGAIQDFRLTKGIARYSGTGNFTPPAAAFPTK